MLAVRNENVLGTVISLGFCYNFKIAKYARHR